LGAWSRGIFDPKIIEGREAAIEIAPLDMELPLAEIYAGVQYP
jgi:hypothetical protein